MTQGKCGKTGFEITAENTRGIWAVDAQQGSEAQCHHGVPALETDPKPNFS